MTLIILFFVVACADAPDGSEACDSQPNAVRRDICLARLRAPPEAPPTPTPSDLPMAAVYAEMKKRTPRPTPVATPEATVTLINPATGQVMGYQTADGRDIITAPRWTAKPRLPAISETELAVREWSETELEVREWVDKVVLCGGPELFPNDPMPELAEIAESGGMGAKSLARWVRARLAPEPYDSIFIQCVAKHYHADANQTWRDAGKPRSGPNIFELWGKDYRRLVLGCDEAPRDLSGWEKVRDGFKYLYVWSLHEDGYFRNLLSC